MNSDNKSYLQISTQLSGRIEDASKKFKDHKITENEFSRIINQSIQSLTIDGMYNEFENKKVLNEYMHFVVALIEKLISDKSSYSYISENKSNYIIASQVMGFVYIFAAYLIRTDELQLASNLLTMKMRDTMSEHYLPRAVYTLSARSNVKFEKLGWTISISKDIYLSSKKIRTLFYNDEEMFTDFVAQADFLQYYEEYMIADKDLYSGYPNFLYVKKKRVMPLINKIIASDNNAEDMQELIMKLSRITSGDLFMNNQWSYHD